eukprot:764967-Hanusia_phi.AAC.8
MSFEQNKRRIQQVMVEERRGEERGGGRGLIRLTLAQSIAIAKREGARMRLGTFLAEDLPAPHALTGPELEISGYGCEDHFLEEDTLVDLAWRRRRKGGGGGGREGGGGSGLNGGLTMLCCRRTRGKCLQTSSGRGAQMAFSAILACRSCTMECDTTAG